jgi:hypothetical protein
MQRYLTPIMDLNVAPPPSRHDDLIGRALGLDMQPGMFGNQNNLQSRDTRTGIPPVFTSDARDRWARERAQRALERLLK